MEGFFFLPGEGEHVMDASHTDGVVNMLKLLTAENVHGVRWVRSRASPGFPSSLRKL